MGERPKSPTHLALDLLHLVPNLHVVPLRIGRRDEVLVLATWRDLGWTDDPDATVLVENSEKRSLDLHNDADCGRAGVQIGS